MAMQERGKGWVGEGLRAVCRGAGGHRWDLCVCVLCALVCVCARAYACACVPAHA